MSYEQKTRIKYELPRGDWTVVARLSDFAMRPYQKAHADFMQDTIGLQPNEVDVDEDGHLFVALKTIDSEGETVVCDSASQLYKGIARLRLEPEILAFTIPTKQLSPERALSESFPYLDQDVSLEMYEAIENLHGQPIDDSDLFVEMDHLLDA